MKVNLKKANEDDKKFLFDLRNKDYVYKNSGTPRMVEWQEHINWLERVFSGQANKYLFVIEVDRERAGQVRFDIELENKQAIVNISLLKKFHGKGIAKEAIEQGIDKMAKEKEIKKFIAEIHQDNTASQKLFEKLGFVFQSQDDIWRTYLKKYV
ncbi:MAG: GNAT family N-acetyltransferase [bacterium]|nr:GNAT family N-acetyltransferase [bacterium]